MIRKMLLLPLVSGILFSGVVNASDTVRPARQKYIDEHKDDAIRDMQRTGVPASITLAQALLESQNGNSALAREANNHFGIKCSDWKGDTYIQDDDKKDECFRKYNSTLESYDDHSNFLRTRPRYAFLFDLEITDYKGWAHGLKKAGYATEPAYATRLIKIIEDNQLYLLDKEQQPELIAGTKNSEETAIASSTKKTIRKVHVPSVDVVDPFAKRKVQTINGVKCIMVNEKDNMRDLAKEFELGFWQLPKYNELASDAKLVAGQIVFLEPRKKKGLTSTYTVRPGDTIASIAEENGMKSKYIYKYNKLDKRSALEPGQVLKLQ